MLEQALPFLGRLHYSPTWTSSGFEIKVLWQWLDRKVNYASGTYVSFS